MARSDDPFNAACVAIPARTLCPAMLLAFMPARAAAVCHFQDRIAGPYKQCIASLRRPTVRNSLGFEPWRRSVRIEANRSADAQRRHPAFPCQLVDVFAAEGEN